MAADGPFNHHLVVDAGAGFAATGAALLLAEVLSSRQVRIVALAAYLVHALSHLAYHLRHAPAALPAWEQTLTWLPLALGVALAVGLLLRLSGARAASPPASRGGARLMAGDGSGAAGGGRARSR